MKKQTSADPVLKQLRKAKGSAAAAPAPGPDPEPIPADPDPEPVPDPAPAPAPAPLVPSAGDPDDNLPAPKVKRAPASKKTSDMKRRAVIDSKRHTKPKMTPEAQSAVDWLFRRK